MPGSAPVLLPNDFVVAAPCSFPNHPSRRDLERPSVSVERDGVAALRHGNSAPTPITGCEHALFGFENPPISRSPIRAEPHGPDALNHYRAARIRRGAAASGNLENGTVHELTAQFRDPFLPPLRALLFEGADFSAAVPRSRRRGVGGWLNREGLPEHRSEIVRAPHAPSPPGRCRIQQ